MNIVRENIDNVNAILKVSIEKADYEKAVADQLKEYRQKASVPGFRPGKVPAGLIKKRFGTAVLVDEVNKLLSQKLSGFLVEEKLNILGEPLPNEELQKTINWETDENFEFAFDIALAPEVNVVLDENTSLNYYNIAVSDEMVQKQVESAENQLGKNVPDDEINEKSTVRGDFVQLDENGEVLEGGIQPKAVLIAIDRMKSEEIRNSIIGKKVGDSVVFDPVAAFDNRHEVGHMLNISHDQADALNSNFSYTITEILKYEKAELNEELFKRLYGDETEIKDVEEFKSKIREDLAKNLVYSSDHKFALDVRDNLMEKANVQLPEAFLKRWLITVNKELTVEQVENEFAYFIEDLKWQLIKDSIVKQNDLKVTKEEVDLFAKQMARAQYNQYGIFDIPEEQLESFAKMILEKQEEAERIYKKLFEDKVIGAVKEKITLNTSEISQEEFDNMMK